MRRIALRWPLVLAGLWAVAAAARVALLDGPLYGDESAHYAVARGWGEDPDNVVPEYHLNGALWWQRPLFSLLLAPGAMLGLSAYRVEHALLASVLPVLVAEVARKAGVRPVLAAGAGLAVAIHPSFVLWGARVFPDSIMAALVLGGLRAHQARRPLAAAGLLLAAVWVKETALLALVALLAWSMWTGRRGAIDLWPLRLDRPASALLFACLLAPLPLAHAVLDLGGRLPGWSTTPLSWGHAGGFLLNEWLVLPVAVGLAWRRSRPYAVAALVYPAFYVAYALLGHGIEPWYLVLPAALSVLAAAVAIDEATRLPQPAVRAGGATAAVALTAVLLAVAILPDDSAAKAAASPLGEPPASLAQLDGRLRGDPLGDVVRAIGDDRWEVVFLVDVGWFYVDHPFAQRAGAVGWAYTDVHIPLGEWSHAVEGSNATVLFKVDRPLNQALRDAYADCVRYDEAGYVLLAGSECPGRTDALRAALDRHGG